MSELPYFAEHYPPTGDDATPEGFLRDQLSINFLLMLEDWGIEPDKDLMERLKREIIEGNQILVVPPLSPPQQRRFRALPTISSVDLTPISEDPFGGSMERANGAPKDPRDLVEILGDREIKFLRHIFGMTMIAAVQTLYSDRQIRLPNGDLNLNVFRELLRGPHKIDSPLDEALIRLGVENKRLQADHPVGHMFTLAFLSKPDQLKDLFDSQDLSSFSAMTVPFRTELIKGWEEGRNTDSQARRQQLKRVLASSFDDKLPELKSLRITAKSAMEDGTFKGKLKDSLGQTHSPYMEALEDLFLAAARLRGTLIHEDGEPATSAGLLTLEKTDTGLHPSQERLGAKKEWFALSQAVRDYRDATRQFFPNLGNPNNYQLALPDVMFDMEGVRIFEYLRDLSKLMSELKAEQANGLKNKAMRKGSPTPSRADRVDYLRQTHLPLMAKLGLLRGAMKGAAEAWLFHRFIRDDVAEKLNELIAMEDEQAAWETMNDGQFVKEKILPVLLKLQQMASVYRFLRALDHNMDFGRS